MENLLKTEAFDKDDPCQGVSGLTNKYYGIIIATAKIEMRRFIALLLSLVVLLLGSGDVMAQEQVCVQVYGGGVVCPTPTPKPHVSVEAGLGDFSPVTLGSLLLISSGALLFLSKKIRFGARS